MLANGRIRLLVRKFCIKSFRFLFSPLNKLVIISEIEKKIK